MSHLYWVHRIRTQQQKRGTFNEGSDVLGLKKECQHVLYDLIQHYLTVNNLHSGTDGKGYPSQFSYRGISATHSEIIQILYWSNELFTPEPIR